MDYDKEEYDMEDDLKDAAVMLIVCVGGFIVVLCICVALLARSI